MDGERWTDSWKRPILQVRLRNWSVQSRFRKRGAIKEGTSMRMMTLVLGMLLAVYAAAGAQKATDAPPSRPAGRVAPGTEAGGKTPEPLGAAEKPGPVKVGPATVHAVPPTEKPGRWKKALDPVFGTEILQVTSMEEDGPCHHEYATVQQFNADATKFWISCGTDVFLYSWNKETMTITSKGKFPAGRVSSSSALAWDDTDPKLMWAIYYGSIHSFNVVTGDQTVYGTLNSLFPEEHAWAKENLPKFQNLAGNRLYKSGKHRLSFSLGDGQGAYIGAGVFDADERKVVWHTPTERLGEYMKVQIDRSGRFLTNGRQGGGFCVSQTDIWDIDTGDHTDIPHRRNATCPGPRGSLAAGFGHGDLGSGTFYGNVYGLSDYVGWVQPLEKAAQEKPYPAGRTRNENAPVHFSTRDITDTWALNTFQQNIMETQKSGCVYTTAGLYQNELQLVRLDGSDTDGSNTRRLAHHHSTGCSRKDPYWQLAKASMSPHAEFVIWSTDWHSEKDQYVFIARTGVDTSRQ